MDIQNENLICTDKNNSLNMDNPYIINVQDEISYDILKDTAWFNCLIILMVLLPPLIPILIIVLLYLEKNIEISKSEKSDELIVIKKNYGKCTKKINFSLENSAIDVIGYGKVEDCTKEYEELAIYLYNTSLKEIDLGNSNIINTPFQSIIIFKKYLGNMQEIKSNLSNICKIFENKINDELKKYDPNFDKNNKDNFFPNFTKKQDGYNQIIKISDYYYIYYAYEYLYHYDNKENFERIDWIFSKDSDRIFIGVIKGNNYLKKIMLNINDIDKFILMFSNNNSYNFKICLKDGRSEDICQFQGQKKEVLDSFIYLLNGQINNLTEKYKI